MKYLNVELEQYLLGSLLHNPIQVDLIPEDFVEYENYLIFREIQNGSKVCDYLADKRYDYIRALMDASVSPFDDAIKTYADHMRELSVKRKVVRLMERIDTMLDDSHSSEVLSAIQASIEDGADAKGVKHVSDVRRDILQKMEAPSNCYPTGMKRLDEGLGGGLYEGFTYGFCGAEKSGKTTLAHTISHQLRCKHLYIAMEMGSEQIEQRNIARSAGINSLAFLNKGATKNQVETAIQNDNIYYSDQVGSTLDEILNTVRMAKIKHGIAGFIVDYWQLIQPQGNYSNEEKHLRDAAQGLANFARKNKLWCIVLAQMNQDGKLFGGGGLRKACDQLYMIKTPEGSSFTRYLEMDASRYTMKENIGSEQNPWVMMSVKSGPYFYE